MELLIHLLSGLTFCLFLSINYRLNIIKALLLTIISVIISFSISYMNEIISYLLPFGVLSLILSIWFNFFTNFLVFGWMIDKDYNHLLINLNTKIHRIIFIAFNILLIIVYFTI